MRNVLLSFVFLLFPLTIFSQIDTVWNGDIDISGMKLKIIVSFTSDSSATIDIPEQGAEDLVLSNVSFNNPKVYFELNAPAGLAVFNGLYYGDSISGKFTQAGMQGRFILYRGGLTELPYPEDLPYNSEEVVFENDGNIFSATLTYPLGQGKFPAVVLISGSGPQTRDEEIAGFKIFKTIAHHLTQNGIAVLRYDDRAYGKSIGKSVDESTTEEFAGDVISAVRYLRTRNNIDESKIGLIGNSEGGIVAPLAAVNYPDIAFIVLMAGTGVKGIDVLREQSRLIMKADNASDKEIDAYIAMIEMIHDALKKNSPLDEIKEKIKQDIIDNFEYIPAEQRKNIKDKYKYAETVAEITISRFNTRWMKFFLDYDPYDVLTRVKCPVLVLFGEKDLQVSPKQNRKFIEEALSKSQCKDYEILILPDANHLFQKALTGSPTEYTNLAREFVPGFLDIITEWIKRRTE